MVQLLDFNTNIIQTLQQNSFLNKVNLRILILHNNRIRTIEHLAFFGLSKLIKIDLSCNSLVQLFVEHLVHLDLHVININNNKFDYIDADIGSNRESNTIITDDYRVCCLMEFSDTVCSSKAIWPQSCKVLLERRSWKAVIILESVLIMSLIVFHWWHGIKYKRTITGKSKYNIIILSLNFNDFLFGAYLIFIFSVNQYLIDCMYM